MALICQLWPHGQDWCWCVLMTCVCKTVLPASFGFRRLDLDGVCLRRMWCLACDWLGLGLSDKPRLTPIPGKQFSPKKLGWMTCAKDEATAWFYLATVCYCRGFFKNISYSSSLCVEASIGRQRLLVSNFTLLTLPQLCLRMFILFLWLLFLQPKNSSHAASEVVQVLRSSWPLKEP